MRALLVGLLAFVLVTQAAAAAMQAHSTPTPRKASVAKPAPTLDQQLERKLVAIRKYRGTIRFFKTHRTLLSTDHRAAAGSKLAYAERRVRQLEKTIAVLRSRVRARDARRFAAMPPKAAICSVFGSYCDEAVAVARCESRLSHERAERSVPRAVPDGLVRATAVRPWQLREGASRRRSSLLPPLRPRLEPVELRLGRGVAIAISVANCGPAPRARVSRSAPIC